MEEQTYKEEISSINRPLKSNPKASDKSTTSFFCKCSLCKLQGKPIHFHDPSIQAKEDYATYEGKEKSFAWVLKELCKASKNNAIKLNIPETVVFSKGKPLFLLHQRADRTLKATTSGKKLKLGELQKTFTTVVHQRKKKEGPFEAKNYGKEVALVRYMLKENDLDLSQMAPICEKGALRLMIEEEFSELMRKRPGNPYWKKIAYIQTVVNCKLGVNNTHVTRYFSHDANNAEAIYQLQRAGKDDNEAFEKEISANFENYCNFICKRIAYLLVVHSQQELLRFCAEFITDDNGKIWLMYADRIAVREIQVHTQEEVLFKRIELRNGESQERLNEDLQSVHSLKCLHQIRMLNEMNKYSKDLKKRIGIDKAFKVKPKDSLSNAAFAKLRPFTPYLLSELIDPEACKKIEALHKPIKHKKVKLTGRGFSKQSLVEIPQKPFWNIAKTFSSRISSKSTSRFSQHLKSWITPPKELIHRHL